MSSDLHSLDCYEILSSYFEKADTRCHELRNFNSMLEPMNDSCIACIVIPAHNEAGNIPALIDSFNSQVFSAGSGLAPDMFEVVIVDNNSTDDTGKIIAEYIKETGSIFKIRVVTVHFPDKEKGAGAPRKLGSDLAIYRAYLRNTNTDFNKFYIIGIDADDHMPEDHIEKAIQTFKATKADVLVGLFNYAENCYEEGSDIRKIISAVNEYNSVISDLIKPFGLKLSGGNHAITAKMYIHIGGFARIEMFEDLNLGTEAEKNNAKFEWLKSYVMDNPRRMLLNPLAYITGEAWSLKTYFTSIDTIRSGTKGTREYNDDEIKKALTVFIGRQALIIAESEKISISASLFNERNRFNIILEHFGIRKELFPDNSLIWFDRINSRNARILMSAEQRLHFLERDFNQIESIVGDNDILLYGQVAFWLLLKEKMQIEIPYMVTMLTYSDSLPTLVDNFTNLGYGLYEVISRNKIYYYKRIEDLSSPGLINNQAIFLLKVNCEGIPYLGDDPAEQLKLQVLKRSNGYVYVDKACLLRVSDNSLECTHFREKIKIADEILLIMDCLNTSSYKKYATEFYELLSEKGKMVYNQLLSEKRLKYARYIMKTFNTLSNDQSLDIDRVIEDLVLMLLGYIETTSYRKRMDITCKVLKSLYLNKSPNIDASINEFIDTYIST